MASVNRQRKKAIRVGVNVKAANAATTSAELIKLMQDLPNTPKDVQDLNQGDQDHGNGE